MGPSPSMRQIVEKYQCGLTLGSWEIRHLRNALNERITRSQILSWKSNSKKAMEEFDVSAIRSRFLALVTGSDS